MSKMSELSQVLDEMIACGEGMIKAASRFLVNGTCCNLEVVPGCCKTFPSLAFPKGKMVPAKRADPKRKLMSRRQYSPVLLPFL